MTVVALAEAVDADAYGGKAVQLGAALRSGLPVPDGWALDWRSVEALTATSSIDELTDQVLPSMCAVRSSAIGEDSAGASFAGTHLSVLGVCGADAVRDAVLDVRDSGRDAGALAYRKRMGLTDVPQMGVVVQRLVDPDVAGVMFTRDPVTGVDRRVIEASWGLGEVVVAGLVTPDRYVLDSQGELVERVMGEKDLAIRTQPGGGTVEESVQHSLVSAPCLDAEALSALHNLALACDKAFGATGHDIEFAFSEGALTLLQRRPITHG